MEITGGRVKLIIFPSPSRERSNDGEFIQFTTAPRCAFTSVRACNLHTHFYNFLSFDRESGRHGFAWNPTEKLTNLSVVNRKAGYNVT